MKVFCKNSFDIFLKNKWYNTIVELYDDNEIYCYQIENEYNQFHIFYNEKHIDYYIGNPKFSNFFYTKQELRKEKLKKLKIKK